MDFLYRLATVLEMRLNHEYWCQPECTWQTNSINITATSDRPDSRASSHWRGIELVFKSLDCFTTRPFFSTKLITRMKSFSLFFYFVLFIHLSSLSFLFIYFFFFWGGGGSSAPMHLLFGAVYRSQGRRGCLDVSFQAWLLLSLSVYIAQMLPYYSFQLVSLWNSFFILGTR